MEDLKFVHGVKQYFQAYSKWVGALGLPYLICCINQQHYSLCDIAALMYLRNNIYFMCLKYFIFDGVTGGSV